MYRCVIVLVVLSVSCSRSVGSEVECLENQSVFYGISFLSEEKNNNGTICMEQLSSIAEGIKRKDRWALKLLDASGGPETKLHWGNRFWLGSKNQCYGAAELKKLQASLTARSFIETKETISPFPVEYYGIYFYHNSTFQVVVNSDVSEFIINMGLCLPASCTEEDVYSLVEEYFSLKKLNVQKLYNMEFKIDQVRKIRADFSWMKERRFTVFVCSIVIIIIMTIFATWYDLSNNRKDNVENDLLNKSFNKEETNAQDNVMSRTDVPELTSLSAKLVSCFNLYKNAKSIFDLKVQKDNEKFKTIFGLRFFLSSWIIMGHTIYYTSDAIYNSVSGLLIFNDGLWQIYSNADFVVDSFITISGFLMGYSFLDMEIKRIASEVPKPNTKNKFLFIIFGIFSRFIRLTPTYMIALGFAEFISKWRFQESFYWISERTDLNCPKYWFRNLFYFSNFYPRLDMCMGWTWYMNVDMQLFVLCFSIMVFTESHFKIGVRIFIIIMLASNFYVSYIAYSLSYKPFLSNKKVYFDDLYQILWLRIAPYVVGIFSGYLIRKWNGELKISKNTISLCWMLCIGIFGILIFGFTDKDMSYINSALYVGWSRTCWSIATAWFLAACITDNGGILGRLLSLKVWIPFSRVSFSVYLIHPIIITTFSSFKESAWEGSALMAVVDGLGFVVISYIFSFIFSLIFESPLVGITKILVEGGKKSMVNKKYSSNKTNVKNKLN